MKIQKEKRTFFSSLAILQTFVCVCVVFTILSSSFCKEDTTNTATSNFSTSTPLLIIDAGHGGEDGGAVGKNGVLEKEINLKISKNLYDLATALGYEAILTRSEDILLYDRNTDYNGRKKALDLLARVKIAENYNDAVFISIHMNSFSDAKYSGLQVYYSSKDPRSKLLASEIQNTVKKTLQNQNNRKIKEADSSIFVLDKITHPAVLIECGFLSNQEECELLSSEEYQKKLALSIFCALSKYIETPT